MKIVSTNNAPKAIGPYSQGVIVDGILYTAGQIAINPETQNIDAKTIEEQAEQVCKNLGAILNEANTSFENVIKTTVFITDLSKFGVVNDIYGKYFISNPARSCVEVNNLPKNALIEIEVIAKI